MLIILEGADGAGKTTLNINICKMIEKKFYIDGDKIIDWSGNAERLIPTKPKDLNRITEVELYKNLKNFILAKNWFYVCDRGMISDIVYRIFDEYSSVTIITKFKEFIDKYANKIFLVYCKNSKSEEYMLKRGDNNPIAIQKHKEICKIYDIIMDVLSKNFYNYAEYDFTNSKSVKNVMKAIEYFVFMNIDN